MLRLRRIGVSNGLIDDLILFCPNTLFPQQSCPARSGFQEGTLGPVLRRAQLRSDRRLGPSGSAKSKTSSRAGVPGPAWPGTPYSEVPMACWTAIESTFHQRRAHATFAGASTAEALCARSYEPDQPSCIGAPPPSHVAAEHALVLRAPDRAGVGFVRSRKRRNEGRIAAVNPVDDEVKAFAIFCDRQVRYPVRARRVLQVQHLRGQPCTHHARSINQLGSPSQEASPGARECMVTKCINAVATPRRSRRRAGVGDGRCDATRSAWFRGGDGLEPSGGCRPAWQRKRAPQSFRSVGRTSSLPHELPVRHVCPAFGRKIVCVCGHDRRLFGIRHKLACFFAQQSRSRGATTSNVSIQQKLTTPNYVEWSLATRRPPSSTAQWMPDGCTVQQVHIRHHETKM